MNSILREEREVPVLANEAIEVHLSYLRPAVEQLSAKIDILDVKIDRTNTDLTERIMKIQASWI